MTFDSLHLAKTPEDWRVPPGNRLAQLKGNRAGQYSMRINQQYRLCFRWVLGHAEDVEIIDYLTLRTFNSTTPGPSGVKAGSIPCNSGGAHSPPWQGGVGGGGA